MREPHTRVSISLDWGHWRICNPALGGWVRGVSTARCLERDHSAPGIKHSGSQHSRFTMDGFEIAAHRPSTFCNAHGFTQHFESMKEKKNWKNWHFR